MPKSLVIPTCGWEGVPRHHSWNIDLCLNMPNGSPIFTWPVSKPLRLGARECSKLALSYRNLLFPSVTFFVDAENNVPHGSEACIWFSSHSPMKEHHILIISAVSKHMQQILETHPSSCSLCPPLFARIPGPTFISPHDKDGACFMSPRYHDESRRCIAPVSVFSNWISFFRSTNDAHITQFQTSKPIYKVIHFSQAHHNP